MLSGVGGAKTIAMEFYGLDIDHLLRLLSYAAQVTIVKSDQVSGPITVIAPEPVPLDVAFQILDSVLQVRGFTMIKMPTGVYKVIPIADAMQSGVPLQFGNQLQMYPPGDELITQVIPLKNLSANDVVSQLQSVISQGANVVPTSTNSLIITDSAANIHRALALIENAENELSGGLKVYRLQYYNASDMSDVVSSVVLSRGGGGAGGMAGGPRPTWERRVVGRTAQPQQRGVPQRPQPAGPQAVAGGMTSMGPEFAYPDTRSNSLIVLATPIHRRQIEDLIAQLDRPVSLAGSYYVYPVQNLVASQLAASIAPLIGAEVTRTGPGEAGGQAARGAAAGAGQAQRRRSEQQGYTQPFSQGQGTGYRGTSLDTTSPSNATGRPDTRPLQLEPLSGEASAARSANAFMIAQAPDVGVVSMPAQVAPQPEAPPAAGGAPPSSGAEAPETASITGAGVSQAVIVADDNTNTLLISASPEQIDLVEQMLEKLDVLPPQVHIRAIIAEVTLSRDTSLGFQWENLRRTWGTFNGARFAGNIGTNLGVKNIVRDANNNVTSTPSGFFATLSGQEFDAVVNALTSDSRARVLSAPSIFTASNQPARIDISQQIPIPTGTFQTTTGAGTISTSIGYRSVGIVLDVTPRVTQGDVVQMDISVSADEPGAEVVVADLSYPSINQRLVETNISVPNGYTVVLGGLMRESITHTASRIPLLGDLPLIGPLFSSTKASKSKSELLLFLTPFIVRNPAELASVSEREASRLPDVPKSLRGSLAGPERETPALEAPALEAPGGTPETEGPAPPEQEKPAPAASPGQATEKQPAAAAPKVEQKPAAPAAAPQPAPIPEPSPTPPTPQPAPTPAPPAPSSEQAAPPTSAENAPAP